MPIEDFTIEEIVKRPKFKRATPERQDRIKRAWVLGTAKRLRSKHGAAFEPRQLIDRVREKGFIEIETAKNLIPVAIREIEEAGAALFRGGINLAGSTAGLAEGIGRRIRELPVDPVTLRSAQGLEQLGSIGRKISDVASTALERAARREEIAGVSVAGIDTERVAEFRNKVAEASVSFVPVIKAAQLGGRAGAFLVSLGINAGAEFQTTQDLEKSIVTGTAQAILDQIVPSKIVESAGRTRIRSFLEDAITVGSSGLAEGSTEIAQELISIFSQPQDASFLERLNLVIDEIASPEGRRRLAETGSIGALLGAGAQTTIGAIRDASRTDRETIPVPSERELAVDAKTEAGTARRAAEREDTIQTRAGVAEDVSRIGETQDVIELDRQEAQVREAPDEKTRTTPVRPQELQGQAQRQVGRQTEPGGVRPGEGIEEVRALSPVVQQRFPLPRREGVRVRPLSKVRQLDDARRSISKALGIPIRTGKFRQRALGIFKVRPKVVRTKIANDMVVMAHEVGHFFEKELNFDKLDERFDNELLPIGLNTSRPNASKKTVRSEGVAEFYRRLILDESDVRKAAPEFYKVFNQAVLQNPKLKRGHDITVREFQELMAQTPQERIAASIQWNSKNNNSLFDLDSIYVNWVDDLFPIRRVQDFLYDGTAPNILSDAYKQNRLARGSDGRAQVFLEDGIRSNDNTKLTDGIFPLLQEIRRRNLLDEFQTYLKAKRIVVDLGPRKLVTNEIFETAEETVEQFETDHPEFIESQRRLVEFTDGLLTIAVENRLLTPDEAFQIKELNQAYVPFSRVFDEAANPKTSTIGPKGFFKRIRGRNESTLPPIEALVINTHTLVRAIENQKSISAIADMAKIPGAGLFIERMPAPPRRPTRVNYLDIKKQLEKIYNVPLVIEAEPVEGVRVPVDPSETVMNIFNQTGHYGTDERVFTTVRDGKREYYSIGDQMLYDAIMGNPQYGRVAMGLLTKLGRTFARTLRTTATATLSFVVRNPARDTIIAGIQSGNRFIPVVDSFIGLRHLFLNDEVYKEFRLSKAGQATLVSSDIDRVKRSIDRATRGKAERFFRNLITNPLHVLQVVSEAMENSTRIGEFVKAKKRTLAQGMTIEEALATAAFNAREVTVDFQRAGIQGRRLNTINAFFNATIQGRDRFVRTVKDNPKATLSFTALYVTLPAILSWLQLKDDEEYQELADWERAMYFHFRIPGVENLVRFPKPHDVGFLFGTKIESVLEHFRRNNPEALVDETFDELREFVSDEIIRFIPTALSPVLEVISNYDFFRDRDIVNRFDKKLPREEQFSRWNSEVSKELSKLMPSGIRLSPAQLDHLFYGYTAGIGRDITEFMDEGIVKIKGADKPVRPAKRLTERAPVSVFVSSGPASSSKSISDLYKLVDRIEGLETAIKRNTGNRKIRIRLQRELQDVLREVPSSRKQIKRARTFMSNRFRVIKNIYANPRLSSQEKRKRIDNELRNIVDRARVTLGKE